MCVDSDRKHSQLSFNPVTYDVRNLEIWDDLFFQHHTDCNRVQMVDVEYELRKKSEKKKPIPVPNGIERLKVSSECLINSNKVIAVAIIGLILVFLTTRRVLIFLRFF